MSQSQWFAYDNSCNYRGHTDAIAPLRIYNITVWQHCCYTPLWICNCTAWQLCPLLYTIESMQYYSLTTLPLPNTMVNIQYYCLTTLPPAIHHCKDASDSLLTKYNPPDQLGDQTVSSNDGVWSSTNLTIKITKVPKFSERAVLYKVLHGLYIDVCNIPAATCQDHATCKQTSLQKGKLCFVWQTQQRRAVVSSWTLLQHWVPVTSSPVCVTSYATLRVDVSVTSWLVTTTCVIPIFSTQCFSHNLILAWWLKSCNSGTSLLLQDELQSFSLGKHVHM